MATATGQSETAWRAGAHASEVALQIRHLRRAVCGGRALKAPATCLKSVLFPRFPAQSLFLKRHFIHDFRLSDRSEGYNDGDYSGTDALHLALLRLNWT